MDRKTGKEEEKREEWSVRNMKTQRQRWFKMVSFPPAMHTIRLQKRIVETLRDL